MHASRPRPFGLRAGPPAGLRHRVVAIAAIAGMIGLVLPAVAAPPAAAAFDPSKVRISLHRVVGGLVQPILVTNAGDGSNRLFVIEKNGQIRIVKDTTLVQAPFLDLSRLVSSGGEQGLLGLAFHPGYRSNHRFYVDYTDVFGDTIIAEYRQSATNPDRADPSTRRVLMRIRQPFANHNGGNLAFGPDGYLYIGMGDGGSEGDPGNRSQSLSTLLGKMLRIDVDHRTGTLPYGIPRSNPFVGRPGLDAIWSYGLRNPWRFSFDRLTGDLWIGDVGGGRFEEIDRATRASGLGRGVNYGWRVMEGRACFDPLVGCRTAGLQLPIATYGHNVGCAVTGGFVYRGRSYPLLQGAYLFSDYCSGRIWSLASNGPSTQTPHLLLASGRSIVSFGESESGELYVADLAGGEILRVVASAH